MSRSHFTPGAASELIGAEPAKRRWRTPRWFIQLLREEIGPFALDAAADAENAHAPVWISRDQDTLVTEWAPLAAGGLVWYNPPYGARAQRCPEGCKDEKHTHRTYDFPGTGAFVERALQQSRDHKLRVLMLLESATDAGWWRQTHAVASVALLLPRMAFEDENGVPMGNPAGSNTLFILGDGPPKPTRCWDVKAPR